MSRHSDPGPAHDLFGRPLESLRLSVIDRCDLRCAYCMPEEDYAWLPKEDILSFDEIERTVDAFGELGVRKVRLTGGEPLLRGGLVNLVSRLARHSAVEDLAMDDERDAAGQMGPNRCTRRG